MKFWKNDESDNYVWYLSDSIDLDGFTWQFELVREKGIAWRLYVAKSDGQHCYSISYGDFDTGQQAITKADSVLEGLRGKVGASLLIRD
jgi:hypothetical protein